MAGIEERLGNSITYLYTLQTMNGQPLSASRRKTFIIGLKTAAISFISLSQNLFERIPTARYILSYKLGQDHIETLFSKIRSKGGFNNNPDVVCFKAALKSLLVKSDITPSPNANCVELDSDQTTGSLLLLVSTTTKRRPVQSDDDDAEEDEFEDDSYQVELQLNKPIADITEYIGNYQHNEYIV